MASYVSKHTGAQIDAAVSAVLSGNAGSGGSGGAVVDATLTVSGAAADAKVTGDRLTALSEEMAAHVEEKQYRHTNLPAGGKVTIYSDNRYDHAPYVFLGKNFWPNTPYISPKYIAYGMSCVTDEHNITIKGAPTTGASFAMIPENGGSEYWPLPDGLLPGDSVDLHLFADINVDNRCPSVNVRIYDASKTQLLRIPCSISAGGSYAVTANQVIPEGATYMMFQVPFSVGDGTAYNRTIHPVFVKSDTVIIDDLAFDNGMCRLTLDTATDNVCTAPYESSVKQVMTFSQYIAEIGIPEEAVKASVVTPEMFGAYADNYHDDTAAIQACIDYAYANKKKAVGGGQYATAFPIRITGTSNVVEISNITYSGSDCAVVVSGSYNKVRIHKIYCSKGAGFRLQSDSNCQWNDVHLGYVLSAKNGVEYIATYGSIVGNRLTFDRISVEGTGDCIYQTGEDKLPAGMNHGNNNFIGGRLDGGNWAVYGAKGRDTYTTLQMEGTSNGIHSDSVGMVRVIAPRYAELWREAFDKTDGSMPRVPGKGLVCSFNPTQAASDHNNGTRGASLSLVGGENCLTPQNLDLTAVPIEYPESDGSKSVLSKLYPGASEVWVKLITRLNAPIADSFLTFGNHILIKNPAFKRKKTIKANDAGYAGDYSVTDKDDEFFIYEEFTIGASGCDYTLPPSYDQIAFNRFWVNQPAGTSCTLRDWRGTVIFDGATLGEGRYEVSARLADGALTDGYDNHNQVWDISKQGVLVATMPQAAN